MLFLYYVLGGILLFWLLLSILIATFLSNVIFKRENTWYQKQGHKLVTSANKTSKENAIEKKQRSHGDTFWHTYSSEICSIMSSDGLKLSANIFRAKKLSNKWVLCIHGYRSNGRIDMAYPASKLVHKGYNCVVLDLRSHGKSEGSMIGMGGLEQFDIQKWVEYILTIDEKASVVLFGDSMGATTVMMSLDTSLSKCVRGVIADCGYTSLKGEFQYLLKTIFKLPFTFPIIPIVSVLYRAKLKHSFYGISAKNALKNNKLPILFFHGGGDTFVPSWMSKENAKSTLGRYELVLIEGAPHFSSIFFDEKLYFESIFSFLTINL